MILYRGISRIVITITFVCLLGSFAGAQENLLTTAEAQAGYDLLFNGMDTLGWHGYQSDTVPDAWVVATDPPLGPRLENRNSRGQKQHMLSNKKYMNFDLKVEVKTEAVGKSGIRTRFEELVQSPEIKNSGPEFQICGPASNLCISLLDTFGACHHMFPVKEELRHSWYNAPGQWNQIRIIAYDSNYVHYGNGKKLLEYKIRTEEFITAYYNSKYASDGNNGRYYHIHPGSFLLVDHATRGQAFRNIKAKELTDHPFTQEFPDGQWPDELDQEYVFGKRGCTDSTADNFDPEAEVDDGTCEEVSVNHRAGAEWKARLIRKGGEWNIRLSAPHVSAKLYSISGTEVALRQNGDKSEYSLSGGVAPGLYVLHTLLDGTPATQMLMIP